MKGNFDAGYDSYCCNNFKMFGEKGQIFDRRVGTDLTESWWKYTVMTIMGSYMPLWFCPFCGTKLLSEDEGRE